MQVQTLRCVPLSDVLSRLDWSEIDVHFLMEYFSGKTVFEGGHGINSHTLVPWDDLMDELADCFAELGYNQFSVHHVFPADIFTNDPHTFVDLEN